MSRCRRCILPDQVPGANLDAEGICAFCRTQRKPDQSSEAQTQQARQEDLEAAIKDCRGQAEYDAVVCLSGG